MQAKLEALSRANEALAQDLERAKAHICRSPSKPEP